MVARRAVSKRISVAVVVATAALAGGCTHWWENVEKHFGSLKDDSVSMPAAKVATPKAVRRTTTGSIDPRTPTASIATAPPTESTVPAPSPAAAAAAAATATLPAPSLPPATAPIETASTDTSKPAPDTVDSIQAANARARIEARIISRQLYEEGERLISMGRVIEGRTRLFAAMEGANPEVLLALGRSFDAFYLSKLASSDGAPDAVRAVALYQRAIERGSTQAVEDLARLKAVPAASDQRQPPVNGRD